jgi:cytochrome c biogenesis protein
MASAAPPDAAPRAPSHAVRDALELVSSMRFAIALFVLICVASIIGTVVTQNQPQTNYVNQFGPFWAEVFAAVGLYTIYSTPWFLLILAFLVTSTSLCIARNTPKIIADLRSYKESLREQALAAFHHRAEGTLAAAPDTVLQRTSALLASHGWQARAQVRGHGTMVAARKGMANKIGYLSAHSAIVLICIGGLLDGDLVVRAQMAVLGKTPFSGGGLIRDVAPAHRLSERNPTFRGNLLVSEGGRAGVAVLNMSDGVVLQELPFDVELKKFRVDFYDTGMPKLFASDIVIHDRETGAQIPATVKVNEPAHHRGIAIYQSSFDDGGSRLKLTALPMKGGARGFDIESTVGGSTNLVNGDEKLTLEFTGLRVINVENLDGGATGDADSATDVRKVDLASSLDKHLGSGAKSPKDKSLRNVGPSFSYKLRDTAGQAREFNNYMLPVQLGGQSVFLAGVRDTPAEQFRYLRIPADEQGNLDGWLRLKSALADPAQREKAARRYVALATPPDKPQMAEQLMVTAQRVLQLFAGAEQLPAPAGADAPPPGGLNALALFIESTVPEAERQRISEVLLRILNGCLFELANQAREADGLKPMAGDDENSARFMQQAVLSLSDAAFYPAPVLLQLADFTQVQASVFQVARAPGQKLVYLGATLLIIGVFAMLYIRERRLWIWLQPAAGGGTQLRAALSTTRRTLDADAEFETLKTALLHDAQPVVSAAPAEEPR